MTERTATVTRTHRLGRPLTDRERTERIAGPVSMHSRYSDVMKRFVDSLTVERLNAGGHNPNPPIPDLQDPVLMTLHTSRAMLFRGWEEIDGQRYYQVWWIQWVGW